MPTIEEQLTLLKRGAEHIVSEEELIQKLKLDRQLRVKLGVDPTRPDLHIGHTVVLRKMRQFQDLGHKVILLIGDFTATIGDPTGKSKTRPMLSLEQTRHYGKSYIEQATLVLDDDPDKLEIRHNSEWLAEMGFAEVIRLAGSYTVARLLERDDFNKRYTDGVAISVHEFLYPLSQGYDSVPLRADIELGGTDQLFNLMVGRDVQVHYGLDKQVALTVPLLEGLDGVQKMSKSLDNYIGITEDADVMFKKAMRVPDNLLLRYTELCTGMDLQAMKAEIDRDVKAAHRVFARELVRLYHGQVDGFDAVLEHAEARYDYIAQGGIPDNIPVVTLAAEELDQQQIWICKALVLAGLASSNGDARRFIQNSGIKLDGDTVTDFKLNLDVSEPRVLQRGKDTFVKVQATP